MEVAYFSKTFLLSLLVLILFVGSIAGGYPAFHLSSFVPVRALKGKLSEFSSNNRLRNSLVVIQFGVSIALIIGTLVVHNQIKFMQETQLGFDKEEVLVIRGASALTGKHDTFIRELESTSGVVKASAVQSLPGYGFDATLFELEQPASYQETSLTYSMVDHNFVDVLDLQIVEGRNFSVEFATDSTNFLINESAAKAFGWENPIGKQLSTSGIQGSIIGVVEDFHYESLHTEIQPMVLLFTRWTPPLITVRLESGQVTPHLESIKQLWNDFVPQQPFSYTFLDQNLQSWYSNEERIARLLEVFTFLAILIAGFGLFGLAAFSAQKRTKEIGIRKVMGASIANIMALLSKDFLKLVILGFVIAIPVAWYAMNQWLTGFAYRIEIGAGTFLLAGGAAIAIALLTVSWQSITAALANPVKSIKSE